MPPLHPRQSSSDDTPDQIRAVDTTDGRSMPHLLDLVISGIWRPSHQPDECGTRPFLKWVRAQGRSPDAPGIPQNAPGSVGITLKKGAPQAPGDKTNPSEED